MFLPSCTICQPILHVGVILWYSTLNHLLASGIGRACCLAFAKEGARGVIVADLNAEGSKETVAQAKAVATSPDFQAEAVEVDVASEESVKAAVARAVQLFGRIHYAVHSAGVSSS